MAEQRGDERLDQGPASAGAFRGDHSAGHQGDIDRERQGGGPPGDVPGVGTVGVPDAANPGVSAPIGPTGSHVEERTTDRTDAPRDTAGDMGTDHGGTTRSGIEGAHSGMAASDTTTGLAGAVERGDRR